VAVRQVADQPVEGVTVASQPAHDDLSTPTVSLLLTGHHATLRVISVSLPQSRLAIARPVLRPLVVKASSQKRRQAAV
jgi:hypothetical protein